MPQVTTNSAVRESFRVEAEKLPEFITKDELSDPFVGDSIEDISNLGRLALRRKTADIYFAIGDLCANASLDSDGGLLVTYVYKTFLAYQLASKVAKNDIDRHIAPRAIQAYADWISLIADETNTLQNIAVSLWVSATIRDMPSQNLVGLIDSFRSQIINPSKGEFSLATAEGTEKDTQEIEALGSQKNVLQNNIRILSLVSITPNTLRNEIYPFVDALFEIQSLITEMIHGEEPEKRIVSITQNSPISVSLSGITDAIQVLRDFIVPWRRRYDKKRKSLEIAEHKLTINEKQLQIAQLKLDTQLKKESVKQKQIETEKLELEIEQQKLAFEKERFELYRSKLELALEIIDQFSSDMAEVDRLNYVTKLLNPLTRLTESNLDFEIT